MQYDGETLMGVVVNGHEMRVALHEASPTYMLAGEAIRAAVQEAVEDQIATYQAAFDARLCALLGIALPSDEGERELRKVEVRT